MGRPKGSKNKSKTKDFKVLREKMPPESQKKAAEKTQNMLAELDKVGEVEESEVVVSKRNSASKKWNALTFEQRKEAVQYMMDHGYLPTSLKMTVSALFCNREEETTRFGDLLFNMQDAVTDYFRKR